MEINNFDQSNIINIIESVSLEKTNSVPAKEEQFKIYLCDSDSGESTNINETGKVSEKEQRVMDAEEGEEEHKKVIKEQIKCNKSIYWKKSCPDLKTDGNLDLVEDLMKIDLKKLMDAAQNVKIVLDCHR